VEYAGDSLVSSLLESNCLGHGLSACDDSSDTHQRSVAGLKSAGVG